MILLGDDVFYDNITLARNQILFMRDLQSKKENLSIRFATVSEYFQAVLSEEKSFNVFEGDFLPYISRELNKRSVSWTGFYSSRPGLKQKAFETHSLVRAAELASSLILKQEFHGYEACTSLHHDAITGTCRSNVASDYVKRLDKDIQASNDMIRYAYSNIVTISRNPIKIKSPYKAFVIYNPINWEIEKVISLPIADTNVAVHNHTGNIIPSQSHRYSGNHEIYLNMKLPPISFTTIFLSSHDSSCTVCSKSSEETNKITVKNGIYTLSFDNGLITKIATNDTYFNIKEKIIRFDASSGGSYEFRPLVMFT